MTVAEAQSDLLGLIGIEDAQYASTQVNTRILSDINATLQKLWTMLPPWWSTNTTGELLRAPVQVSGLTVTNGSKTVVTSGTGTLPVWSEACAIRVSGDPRDNEIVTRDSAAASFTLALPYAGQNASGVTATVYNDCITLGTSVSGVQPPVIILGEHELVPLRSQRDVQTFGPSVGYGHREAVYGQLADSFVVAEQRDVDVPIGYLVERGVTPTGRVINRLRVSPFPDKDYVVQFEERAQAPRIASLSPGSTEIPIPQDYAESIFMPVLRYQFTTQKHFDASAIRAALKEQYQEAFQLMAKLKPQTARVGHVRVSDHW
jgi:hypothetical protein